MSDQSQVQPTEVAHEFVIDNLETLKVIADPLRKRILECFDHPKTVKEVARVLGTNPSKLYYHVNLLDEHGLLKVTDTRIVSGIIEKQYQVSARQITIKSGLLSPGRSEGDESLNVLLASIVDAAKDELRASIRAGVVLLDTEEDDHRKLFMGRLKNVFTPEQAKDFRHRLKALLEEFGSIDTDESDAGAQAFTLQLSFFPTVEPPLPDDVSGENADD